MNKMIINFRSFFEKYFKIFYTKKILKLNRDKIFVNNETAFKDNQSKEKYKKLLDKFIDKKPSIKEIEDFKIIAAKKVEEEAKVEKKKLNDKIKKLETRIAKVKAKRDFHEKIYLKKIENKLNKLRLENFELEKQIADFNKELSNNDATEELNTKITNLISRKEAEFNKNARIIDIIESRRKIEEDKQIHLSLSHLTMKFGGLKAVDDLSFDVKKGEIFGLIGPNGAGKTTVFNCITQFYRPNEGDIYYNDVNDETHSLLDFQVHDIINLGIVRTFQNVELVWELNVLDNLLVGAHTLYSSGFFTQLLHFPKLKYEENVLKTKALKLLDTLDILAYKDSLPYGLPYGVLKKIEFARTLMTKPSLIILDEPAAGLNDLETKELADIIKKIRDEFNLTIFLVEHDMGLVMNVCDTVCAISFGKKIAIGTPKEIQKNPKVQEAYLGGE